MKITISALKTKNGRWYGSYLLIPGVPNWPRQGPCDIRTEKKVNVAKRKALAGALRVVAGEVCCGARSAPRRIMVSYREERL